MTAFFDLVLDTHAPQITWGEWTGNDAGETLSVAYTLNEPGITSATIQLPFGGGSFPMRVDPAALVFDVPADSTQGDATITVELADDVGNNATAELVVPLDGSIPPVQVPPPTTGGMPRGRTFEPRVLRDRSSATASSRDRVLVRQRTRSSAEARSHYTLPTRQTRRSWSFISGRSRDTTHVATGYTSASELLTRPDVIRRREGPGGEDELILLDLL